MSKTLSTVRDAVVAFGTAVVPWVVHPLYRYKRRQEIVHEARMFRIRHSGEDLETLLAASELQSAGRFFANQKRTEIVELLRLLEARPPKYICEIGTFRGGTLFLLCQIASSDARIISIDTHYPHRKKRAIEQFALPGQKLYCLESHSRSEKALKKVKRLLKGAKLDLLFIDGDHSYDGVKSDFDLYTPLVRSGGMVAIHDIVIDYQQSRGIDSTNHTGGVPLFWQDIKDQFATEQIIEQEDQDGYGIGIVKW